MTIGERIRLVRKETGLNQTDFGEKVGLRQSSLGQIESGVRNATDRTILLICQKYSVREEWLRDGIGKMFDMDNTIITQLSDEYDLDGFEKAMIEGFLKMRPEERKVIKSYVRNLVDEIMTNEDAYKDYREEYLYGMGGRGQNDKGATLHLIARGGQTEEKRLTPEQVQDALKEIERLESEDTDEYDHL